MSTATGTEEEGDHRRAPSSAPSHVSSPPSQAASPAQSSPAPSQVSSPQQATTATAPSQVSSPSQQPPSQAATPSGQPVVVEDAAAGSVSRNRADTTTPQSVVTTEDLSAPRAWRTGSVLRKSSQATLDRKSFAAQSDQFLTEEIAVWMSVLLAPRVITSDLKTELQNGEVLCEIVNLIDTKHRVSYHRNAKAGFQSKENLEMFQKRCKELGVSDSFNASDLANGLYKPVLACLYDLARIAVKYGVRPPLSLQMEKEWAERRELLEKERLEKEREDQEKLKASSDMGYASYQTEPDTDAGSPRTGDAIVDVNAPLITRSDHGDSDGSEEPWYRRNHYKFCLLFLLVLIVVGTVLIVKFTDKK